MCKAILLIIASLLTGCVTYPSYRLPPDSYSEAQEVLSYFNALPLKNQYSLRILAKEEMKKLIKGGVPHIDTNKNVIYIEDLYLKYLYNHRGGKFFHIRKRDLACIIAHEICHKEYNLPDKPLEVHLQVDEKAIGLLNKFGSKGFDNTIYDTTRNLALNKLQSMLNSNQKVCNLRMEIENISQSQLFFIHLYGTLLEK